MPDSLLTFVVPEALRGKRLDQALTTLCPEHSRTRLQTWIKAGNVKVENEIRRPKDTVLPGENIVIQPIYETQTPWSAEDIPLTIIHEDEEILVINKPPGLVVHPGAGNPRHTLLNALLFHIPTLEKIPRAGIVQRLDKDTSGIMVIAKTPTAHTYLVDQLQRRLITREYRAIVTGVMTAGGTIAAPIGRHSVYRKRMAVITGGKPATTHFRVIKKFPGHTYLQLNLETGRTHQIRVHMAHLRHPLVGDPAYGGNRRLTKNLTADLRETIQTFPRQALHAYLLQLVHPTTGKRLERIAPVPEDMQKLLNILEHDANQE